MKIAAQLSESDIRQIIADHFGVQPSAVRIEPIAEQRDGPYGSPATVRACVETDSERPVIAQQTVVMGSATFGPMTITMPTKR